jgi:hypothetical protein
LSVILISSFHLDEARPSCSFASGFILVFICICHQIAYDQVTYQSIFTNVYSVHHVTPFTADTRSSLLSSATLRRTTRQVGTFLRFALFHS